MALERPTQGLLHSCPFRVKVLNAPSARSHLLPDRNCPRNCQALYVTLVGA